MSDKKYLFDNSDLKSQTVKEIKGIKHFFTHTFRKPTFQEEEGREMSLADIIKSAGKVEGQSAVITDTDDLSTNVKFYDKIAKSVEGYAINGVKDEVPVTTEVGDKTVLELIPSADKNMAVWALYNNTYETAMTEEEAEEFEIELGVVRDWKILQRINVQRQREDGSTPPASFEVVYTLREPTEKENKKYRLESTATSSYLKDGARISRTSTNMRVIKDLFDKMIVDIDAEFEIDGEHRPFLNEQSYLDMIPAHFKKGVIFRLFNLLESDLGNSEEL